MQLQVYMTAGHVQQARANRQGLMALGWMGVRIRGYTGSVCRWDKGVKSQQLVLERFRRSGTDIRVQRTVIGEGIHIRNA